MVLLKSGWRLYESIFCVKHTMLQTGEVTRRRGGPGSWFWRGKVERLRLLMVFVLAESHGGTGHPSLGRRQGEHM